MDYEIDHNGVKMPLSEYNRTCAKQIIPELFVVKIMGSSITFGGGWSTEWLHFGIYSDGEVYNIAHNLHACFNVRVQLTNCETKEVTEPF
jgi:hypothetical protein